MEYIIIKSDRKSISLSVNDDLDAVIRAPFAMSDKQIRIFINDNQAWLEQAAEKKRRYLSKYALSDDELDVLKMEAKNYIFDRVAWFSKIMGVNPTGIKITSAKKRFGSCSGKNSLCFSCYLMLYPKEAVDYVIVHELAHITHHNHSKAFYNLISEYMPDYKEREKLLKADS